MTKKGEKKRDTVLTKSYASLLKEIKEKVNSSQLKAAIAVNQELIQLYWEIDRKLSPRETGEGRMGRQDHRKAGKRPEGVIADN